MSEMRGTMPTIADMQKMGIGRLFKLYMGSGWIFEKWYEKVVLIVLGALGLWKIWGFIW